MSTQTRVLNEAIEWAQKEHRIFLKQSLETRLGTLYLFTSSSRRFIETICATSFALPFNAGV